MDDLIDRQADIESDKNSATHHPCIWNRVLECADVGISSVSRKMELAKQRVIESLLFPDLNKEGREDD